jgi:hypothetical protein
MSGATSDATPSRMSLPPSLRYGGRVAHAGYELARATIALHLDRRTRYRAVRAEHATVARLGLEPFAAARAVIEEPAGVGGHWLARLTPAVGTRDGRFQDHAGYRLLHLIQYAAMALAQFPGERMFLA